MNPPRLFGPRRVLLLVLLLSLLLALSPPPRTQAQAPFDVVFRRVRDYLKEQIGRDFVVVSYTYAVQTWDSAALGCPSPGVSYDQEETRGYNWSFEINESDQIFELHSTLDGETIVLCTPIDRAQLVNYQTYRSEQFVIEYPETWGQVTDSPDYAAGFFPAGEESCTAPGMTVQLVEAAGLNANTLLNEAVRQAGLVQQLGAAAPVAAERGLTITYQTACEETIRQYRTTAFLVPESDGGYLIQQFAPAAAFPDWDEAFLRILESFKTFAAIANGDNGDGTNDNAEEALDPARLIGGYRLAHHFVGDAYIGAAGDLPGFRLTRSQTGQHRGFRFSPDGRYLLYITPDTFTGSGERLEIVEGTGRPLTLAQNVAPHFPATWLPDGTQVAYLAPGEEPDTLAVHRVSPDGTNDTVLGTLAYPADCDALEPAHLPERLYWQETGPAGNAFTFQALDDERFLVTTDCHGLGLGLWTAADGLQSLTGPDDVPLRRAALSPAGTRLAALEEAGQLYLIDLEAADVQAVELDDMPQQLAWGPAGDVLYYTSYTEVDTVVVDNPDFAARGERLFGVYPYTSQLNELSIKALDVASGQTQTLWQKQGYAVGRLLPVPNAVGIVFSFVPSDRELVNAFRQNIVFEELRFLMPETQTYWLPPNRDQALLLMYSAQPRLAPVVAEQP